MFSKIFSSVRYSLATLNFIFLVTGIIILSVGISVQVSYNAYNDFLSGSFFSLPAFLMATGVIIGIISVFGFIGAGWQNFHMNLIYVGLMVIIFIFEVSACIAGYVLYNQTAALLRTSLLDTLPLYATNANDAITMLWDEMQRDFECCGVINPADWVQYLPAEHNGDIPMSCCPTVTGAMGSQVCNTTYAYTEGCADAFGEWVSAHALGMAVAGLIFCIIQALAAAAAGWIARRSKFEDLN